jgi:RNA polymerase sigma factor for flagellar operon FliA
MTLAIERPVVRDTGADNSAPDVAELVTAHLPLVGHLVREFSARIPTHVDRDDLRSAALYALVTSARAFDPSRGASFSSFAAIRIRGALRDELRALDWASRSVRKKARGLEAAREELTESLGRSPAAPEVAAALGISVGALASVEADVHRAAVQSLDALGSFDGADAAGEDADAPEAMVLRQEELADLRSAVADLPDRLRFVIEQYFFGQRRMADIAAELGVTESRVSQLRSEALRALRTRMAAASAA